MRKIIFLLFLLLIPVVLASKTETTQVLNINDTATVYGKTLTVLSASSTGKLRVSVDGVDGIVRPGVNRTTNINEMYVEILNFTYVDVDYVETILKIIVNLECGDEACNNTEDSVICCTDCGCEGNLKCINNICMKEECVIQADCDDNDPCTVDKCSDTPPRTCSNTPITQCINDDNCCLGICGPENDTDCITVIEEVEEPVQEEEKEVEKTEEVEEKEVEKGVFTEKEKGIAIIIGVALLVVIIGFFIISRK